MIETRWSRLLLFAMLAVPRAAMAHPAMASPVVASASTSPRLQTTDEPTVSQRVNAVLEKANAAFLAEQRGAAAAGNATTTEEAAPSSSNDHGRARRGGRTYGSSLRRLATTTRAVGPGGKCMRSGHARWASVRATTPAAQRARRGLGGILNVNVRRQLEPKAVKQGREPALPLLQQGVQDTMHIYGQELAVLTETCGAPAPDPGEGKIHGERPARELGSEGAYVYFHSGRDRRRPEEKTGTNVSGAAVVLSQRLYNIWSEEAIYYPETDRLVAVGLPLRAVFALTGRPALRHYTHLIIVGAYAPTDVSEHETEAEVFYEDLAALHARLKVEHPRALVIIGGDFNARVGKDEKARSRQVGPFPFDAATSPNGERMLDFCKKTGLLVANTFFKPAKAIHQATWLSHGAAKAHARRTGSRRHAWKECGAMLDHFLISPLLLEQHLAINARAHPSITTMPELDHRPQVLHLAVTHRGRPGRPRHEPRRDPTARAPTRQPRAEPSLRHLLDPAKCDTWRVEQNEPLQQYRAELSRAVESVRAAASVDEMVTRARDAMLQAGRRHLTKSPLALSAKKPYISEKTRAAQKERWRLFDEAARRAGSRVPDKRRVWDRWRAQGGAVARLVRRDRMLNVRRLAGEMDEAAKRKEVHRLFTLVRELARMGKRRPPQQLRLKKEDGSWTAGDAEVAGRMAKYFATVLNNPRAIDVDAVVAAVPPAPHPPTLDEQPAPVLPPPPPPPPPEGTQPPGGTPPPSPARRAWEAPAMGDTTVTPDEVKRAVATLKNRKAADPHGVVAELFKAGGPACFEMWADILTKVLTEKRVPASWTTARVTPLHKNGTKAQEKSYRGIAISDAGYKLLSVIIYHRLLGHLEPQLLDEQFGFRPRRGVTDCVFTIKRLQEEARRRGLPLYLAFVDVIKAYDSVPREVLFRILETRYGVDPGLVQMLRALYENLQGEVRVGMATSAPFPITTGVRQGCILSPLLFAVYLDALLRSSLEGEEGCRRLGLQWDYARDTLANVFKQTLHLRAETGQRLLRRVVFMLLYADDMVLWAASPAALQQLVDIITRRLAAGGLILSAEKSMVMVTGGGTPQPVRITMDGVDLKTVDKFKYLGTYILASGSDAEDVRCRVGKAWSMFHDLHQTLLPSDVNLKLRTQVLYTSVLAVLLHGCEHWRVTPEMEASIIKTHHGMLLDMLRLSRQQAAALHITKAEARARTGAKDIMGLIERRWLRWGSQLMSIHRAAPSLPSIALAGELSYTCYPEPYNWAEELARVESRGQAPGRRRDAELHWGDQYGPLLVTCLQAQGGFGDFGPEEITKIKDEIITKEAYPLVEEQPLLMRADALARCPHCKLMRNDPMDLETHIGKCHPAAGLPEEPEADGTNGDQTGNSGNHNTIGSNNGNDDNGSSRRSTRSRRSSTSSSRSRSSNWCSNRSSSRSSGGDSTSTSTSSNSHNSRRSHSRRSSSNNSSVSGSGGDASTVRSSRPYHLRSSSQSSTSINGSIAGDIESLGGDEASNGSAPTHQYNLRRRR